MNNNIKAWLLGLGFDAKDGHLRITRGENYNIYGGSEDTHNLLYEKAVKFNEQLVRRGKKLEEITEQEFCDIAGKIGLRINDQYRN